MCLERLIAFYTDVLGMHLLRRKDYPDGWFTLAFLGCGPESETTVLELTHNWDTSSYELVADDIHGACAAIAERGGRVVRPGADETQLHRDRVHRGSRWIQGGADLS